MAENGHHAKPRGQVKQPTGSTHNSRCALSIPGLTILLALLSVYFSEPVLHILLSKGVYFLVMSPLGTHIRDVLWLLASTVRT
jgi:hypothetical protein